MPIKLESSGFYEWHDRPDRVPMLGISTSRLDDCLAHYQAAGFRAIFGHNSFGFEQDNLDFLTQTTNAKRLWFWDVSLRCVDGIYALTELESFGIHPKRPGIDFSRFPALQHAFTHWNKCDTGISVSGITEYNVWHYKPRTKSFEGLEIPLGVTKLELTWANPTSLEGLPVLSRLKELEIHRCRNLSDLSSLPRVAPNLRKLLATTSSKLDATRGVIDHPKLKMALIDGKWVVGDGG